MYSSLRVEQMQSFPKGGGGALAAVYLAVYL